MIHVRDIKNNMPNWMKDIYDLVRIEPILIEFYRRKAGRDIVKQYINDKDPEKREVAEYIKKYGLTTFPYTYKSKYDWRRITVYHDDDGYPYVMHYGKRLYWKKDMTNDAVKKVYTEMCAEQDVESPHCYVQKESHRPHEGSIIAELGAAEACFTLEWIEQCKKAYLFECDEEWVEPYKRTFAPWIEKIEVVPNFVGAGGTDEETIQLDDFFKDKDVTIVKADIEGAEIAMLEGAKNTFLNKIKQAYICTYHRCNHPEKIRKMLESFDMRTEFNRRFMFLFTSPS